MATGHEVVFVSSHDVLEKGKDVITRSPEGRYCCYQLKTGNISVPVWRDIKGEIDELIEQPIEHPDVPDGSPFDSILVTNGTINSAVINRIESLNRENPGRPRDLSSLSTIDINQLVRVFSSAQLAFLPVSLPDFHSYTSLLLVDGTSLLDPRPLAEIITKNLLTIEGCRGTRTELRRRLHASLVVICNLLHRYGEAENHLALIHGYTLAASLVARFALGNKFPPRDWHPSIGMLVREAEKEAKLLLEEAEGSEHWLEGSVFGDGGEVRRARITMVLGTLAGVDLVLRARDEDQISGPRLAVLVKDHLDDLFEWGESAIPYLVTTAMWLERHGLDGQAKSLLERTTRTVVERNWLESTDPLPCSYHGVEDILVNRYQMTLYPLDLGQFQGESMTLAPLLSLCVRRGMRQLLEELWARLIDTDAWQFRPTNPLDYLTAFVEDGVNISLRMPEQGSWKQLQEEAGKPSRLEGVLDGVGYLFYVLWLLVPQRFTWQTVALLDEATDMPHSVRQKSEDAEDGSSGVSPNDEDHEGL